MFKTIFPAVLGFHILKVPGELGIQVLLTDNVMIQKTNEGHIKFNTGMNRHLPATGYNVKYYLFDL